MKVKVIRDTMNEELEVLFSFGYVKEGEIYEAYESSDPSYGYSIEIIASGEEFSLFNGEYEVVQ